MNAEHKPAYGYETQLISASLEQWQRQVWEPAIRQAPQRKEEFLTQSMRWEIKPLYTPADLDAIGFDYHADLGFPGQYPYTRDSRPTGYRSNFWAMTQVTGFGTGQDSAKRWEYMLAQGLDSLIIEYDLPTTNGYDSDDPLVAGEVCRAGMALDTLQDMEDALDFPLDKVNNIMSVCNAPQPVNLAMLIAALEKKGKDLASVRLMMPNAILIEYTCVGRYIFPPKHGLRIATDVIEYVIRNHPTWAPLSVVGAQLYAARGNPVQEIAFSFAIAKTYIDALLERGFTIDEVAPYVRHITGIDTDFFEAVAKLRTYRKVWARVMKEHYGAREERSLRLQLMSSPGTMDMTLQQPLNNIARLGIQALACAIGGGAYAMNIPLHDEAHALPSEEAVAIGAAIQNIVAHESGVADTIDPLAGSYYVEYLTKRMEDEVLAEMARIDALGGGLAAIEQGYFQRQLAEQQCLRNRALETGERKLIGVNHLVKEEKKREIDIFKLDDSAERRQIERLRAVRARRDPAAVQRHLEAVRRACLDGSNLVPPMLAAVKDYVTHGELCGVMREVFGEHDPNALTPDI